MDTYSIILVMLGLMVFLTAFADKLKTSAALLLVVAGLGIGFIPAIASMQIDPEIIFLLFLPPLLFDAAFTIDFGRFRQNLNTISALAFGLVFFTTVGIAAIAYFIIPGMTWPLAFVIGAILAATDAVAAIGITRQLGLSKNATAILEGEGLINDASALIAFKFSVGAVAGISFIWWKASLSFLILIGGGIMVGIVVHVLHALVLRVVKHHHMATLSYILLAPLIAYLIAESLKVSGVLAVVTLGFGVARLSSEHFPEKVKKESKTLWEMIVFLLNGLIFIFIGIEFPIVVKAMPNHHWVPYLGYALIITVVALIIRAIRMFLQRKKLHLVNTHPRLKDRKKSNASLTFEESAIISWSGMRGIVSLAMALSLPLYIDDGHHFPLRNEIIFLTTTVVLLTIVGQGLLLPVIVKRFKGITEEEEPQN